MPPETVRKRLLISGKVQGVWFRQSTKDEAERIGGLKGYARNLEDGRVEVLVQGSGGAVERLVAWCHEGPAAAEVDSVDATEEPAGDDVRDFHVSR